MIYEAERCNGTFKVMYDNKECNRCPRKGEADKHFTESPSEKKLSGCQEKTLDSLSFFVYSIEGDV